MYKYYNYRIEIQTDETILTSHFGKPKIFKVKDRLCSTHNKVDDFVVVTKNKVLHTIPIKECILVPSKAQLKVLEEDKKKFSIYIENINILIKNNKLRPKKKILIKKEVTE